MIDIHAVSSFGDSLRVVTIDGTVLSVPMDESNAHCRAVLEWVANGGVIELPPAPAVPQIVSRFQARAALHLAGLLNDVETLMSAPDTDPLMRLAWVDVQEFRRNSPMIIAMAPMLGLTEQDVDQLFITAAEITA